VASRGCRAQITGFALQPTLGNSIESMDLGFSPQARSLEAVANGSVGRESCVVPVPRAIDEQVARSYVELARGAAARG